MQKEYANMTENETILERIRKWQEEPIFHELTCGNDSTHALLKGELREEKVVLVCPSCAYVQTNIPDMFFSDEFDTAYQFQKNALDSLNDMQE